MKKLYDLAVKDGIRLIEKDGLLAPMGYWGLTPTLKAQICNGCGPGRLRFLVPNRPLGLFDFRPACDIHDYCFSCPRCSFKLANALFKFNLTRQVLKTENNVFRIGYNLVGIYVAAVKSLAGRFCYWKARKG